MPTRRRPKYQPLSDFLAVQSGDERTVTFAQIEALLEQRLPSGAWSPAWWSNTRAYQQSKAWLRVGWRVRRVATSGEGHVVTFVRMVSDTTT